MKKSILTVIIVFVVLTGVLIALVPIEQRRMLVKEYGVLVEDAETNEKSAFILENVSQYPQEILDWYYQGDEYLDFVYNYPMHKDDYTLMIFTAEELNSESVPKLYMYDTRWCYEKFSGGYIRTKGCVLTCIAMASLALNKDDRLDPVKIARVADANYEAPLLGGGIDLTNVKGLAENLGFKVVEHNFRDNNELCDEQIIKDLLDNGNVVIAAMVGELFGGHAIIIREVTDEGIMINDPASESNSDKLWKFEDLQVDIHSIFGLSVK